MKIGDKLLCKQSIHLLYKIEQAIFEEGQYYQISAVSLAWGNESFCVEDANENWAGFYLERQYAGRPRLGLYAWDYFYTSQEVRKLKLEKLK